MKLSVQTFNGVAPKHNPRYLPDGWAQTALNVEAFGRSLKPLKGLSSPVTTLSTSGTLQTIYRFGQDLAAEDREWFSWAEDVDVCRGQISGDAAEWTFYTGDGFPKATNNRLALAGSSTSLPAGYRRLGIPAPTTALTVAASEPDNLESPATLTISGAVIDVIDLTFGLEMSLDGGTTWLRTGPLGSATPLVVMARLRALGGVTATVEGDAVAITTTAIGESAKLSVRWGASADKTISAKGETKDPGTPETRVYTWTWVNIEDGLAMESAPAPPSAEVDVYPGGAVKLTGFSAVPSLSGVVVTHRRIYRATAGIYLFVAEIAATDTEFDDEISAAALGEELQSMGWTMPPDTMQGLTNLPNGIMAGFDGRDVWLCEPYRPYAWPSSYMQAVDFPVVGLGRMDTTLAILTKGTPYFLQGSHPDSMVLVKSDIEQACVSKRSIVSMNGAVFYASPDGLVILSPGGSKLLTEELFGREAWQAFNPSTIHAYGHDAKYVAFFGTTAGGFVYDTLSGQFTMHGVASTGGYADPQNDTLFLVSTNKEVRKWNQGSPITGLWRTKLFGLPQITGFSCAQIEAEQYPSTLKCRVYADGQKILELIVPSRTPFRLPARQARDWEVELDVPCEIFNLAVAQSMEEIAGV